MSDEKAADRAEDFSLFLGGPIYQFFLRIGLIRPPLDRVKWRIGVISMTAWAPLVLLTLWDGRLLGGVNIPFLRDFEVHIRLLVSLPLLIAAEVIIHKRMMIVVRQFLERQIITPATRAKFDALIESAMRLRNLIVAEVGLLVFVLLAGAFVWRQLLGLESDTWYATLAAGGRSITPAGFWYQFVSIPISQFILLRWYYKLILWWRFLWQVSRLELNLVPTHPDRSCGMGFLDGMVLAMTPFLMAHSCLLSGYLANRILHEGAKLTDYYVEIGALGIFLGLVALGPLCVFTPGLIRARLSGLRAYGRLASEYVNAFDRKWISNRQSTEEPLLGTGDIQSLADLGNSFSTVKSIIPFPFGRSSLIGLAVILALPLLPLSLTMFSLQELAMRLIKIVL